MSYSVYFTKEAKQDLRSITKKRGTPYVTK